MTDRPCHRQDKTRGEGERRTGAGRRQGLEGRGGEGTADASAQGRRRQGSAGGVHRQRECGATQAFAVQQVASGGQFAPELSAPLN